MLFEVLKEKRLVGFSYYPMIEVIVGILLISGAFILPILHVIYNGLKKQDWLDILICLGLFLLFFFIGKNLAFQKIKIDSDDKYIHFFQNMREPSLETSLEIDKWNGMLLEKDSTIPSEVKYFIRIVTKDKNIDFYQTINKKEAEQISNSLNTIYKNLKGE